MSVGMDGAVFFWDIFPGTMRSEHYNGKIGTIFVAGTGFRDGSRVFVSTPEKLVKEICTFMYEYIQILLTYVCVFLCVYIYIYIYFEV
jgi:hypothetical protein